MSTQQNWLIIVTLAIAVGTFHGWMKQPLDRQQVAAIEEFVQRGIVWQDRYPPDFSLELLSGETFQLSEHIGTNVVVLNFFTTWCGPCREEMPELDRFFRAESVDRFLLLGIDVEEDRAAVEQFIDELEVTFPVALDPHGEVAKSFQVMSYPTTVLIGADGRVQLYETGAILNAEVAFTEHLTKHRALLDAGEGISLEGYLAGLAAQPELDLSDDDDRLELEGRALEIAQEMPCPCGCEQTVLDCTCQTADKISLRLNEMEFEGRTDTEIMQELGREFCVGAAQ